MEKVKSPFGRIMIHVALILVFDLQSGTVLLDTYAIVQKPERCKFPHAEIHFHANVGELSGSVAALIA